MQPGTSSAPSASATLAADEHRNVVRSRYADIAQRGGLPASGDDCGCGCGNGDNENSATKSATATIACCSDPESLASAKGYNQALGYSEAELAAVPAGADLNLGCGNPFALADLKAGETVLDLGSGAGFDAFIAARALAGTGRVIGVDMTPEMVTRARRNAAQSEHPNVEFRLGEIESLPVADGTVDLIISNCVVNLSPDKPAVYREAFRVLKPGGRVCISDVVSRVELPKALRRDAESLSRCIAGAESVEKIKAWLQTAGFVDIRITTKDESRQVIDTWAPDFDVGEGKNLGDLLVSAIVEARKP